MKGVCPKQCSQFSADSLEEDIFSYESLSPPTPAPKIYLRLVLSVPIFQKDLHLYLNMHNAIGNPNKGSEVTSSFDHGYICHPVQCS